MILNRLANQPVSIFAVEDDDADFKELSRSLKQHGVSNEIIRAKDGVQAINILKANSIRTPFIVLLDLNLPKASGFEVLDFIRGDKKLLDTVVFVMTTSTHEEDLCNAYSKHVAGYLVKTEIGECFTRAMKMIGLYAESVLLPKQV